MLLVPGGGAAAAGALDARPVAQAVEAQAHRRRRAAAVACCRGRRRRRRGFLLRWVAGGGLLRRLVGRQADGEVEVDVEAPPLRRRRRRWRGGPRLVVAAAAAGLGRVRDDLETVLRLLLVVTRSGVPLLRCLQLVMLLLLVVARRGGGGGERAVRLRVDAAGEELALDVRVPVVLDLVVSTAQQPPGYLRPPVCFAARITKSKQV